MAVRAEDRDGAIVAHGIAAADAAAVEIGMCVRSAMAGPVRKASAVCEVWWLCSGGWGVGGSMLRPDMMGRFGSARDPPPSFSTLRLASALHARHCEILLTCT